MILAGMVTLSTLVIGTKADASTVKVATGDTVSGLADKYNVSIDDIVKWNHLNDKNLIIAGDKLNIDGKDIKSKSDFNQNKQQSQQVVEQKVTPVQQTQQAISQPTQQNVQSQQTTQAQNVGEDAKEQIAYGESRGSYTAQNGRYYGKYQLDLSYLGGDLSPQHQEDVFQQYCNDRYGSVEGALSFRQQHGWY